MTSVPADKLPGILKELNETTAWGIARFSDPEYLARRHEVEKRIRQEFIAKGGNPDLEHPIYFFLGGDAEFEKHERNRGYVIPMSEIAESDICFAYGDSMLTFNPDYRAQFGEKYKSSLCAKIFLKNELESLFSHPEFSKDHYLRIEALLWRMPKIENVQNLKL